MAQLHNVIDAKGSYYEGSNRAHTVFAIHAAEGQPYIVWLPQGYRFGMFDSSFRVSIRCLESTHVHADNVFGLVSGPLREQRVQLWTAAPGAQGSHMRDSDTGDVDVFQREQAQSVTHMPYGEPRHCSASHSCIPCHIRFSCGNLAIPNNPTLAVLHASKNMLPMDRVGA